MVILKVIRTVISYVDLNTGKIKAVCALLEPRGFYKYIYWFKRHRILYNVTVEVVVQLHPLEGSIDSGILTLMIA